MSGLLAGRQQAEVYIRIWWQTLSTAGRRMAPWHHLSDYWTNNLCKPAPGWLSVSEAYFALRAQAAVSACLWNWLGSLGDFLLKVHANSTIHHWTWFNHGPSFRVLWIEEAANFYYKSEEKWLMKRNSFFLASMFHQIIDIFLCTFFTFCLKVTRRLTSPMAGGYWKETWKFCFSRLTHILPNESIHCY